MKGGRLFSAAFSCFALCYLVSRVVRFRYMKIVLDVGVDFVLVAQTTNHLNK